MAHKIDFSTGSAAFSSYKKSAWHGLGNIFDIQPDSVNSLLKESKLDFEVGKLPNIHRLDNGTEIISEDSFFTYRKDVNKVLGTVGSRYTVMQNTDAFNVLEPLLKSGKIDIETAGSLDDGKQAFITCKTKEPINVDGVDPVENYFVIFNSHDGSLAIMAYFTPVRIVCNNTLRMSFKKAQSKVSIRHTANAQSRLKQASQILSAAEDNAVKFGELASAMRKTKYTQSKFFDYLANVYCTTDELKQMRTGEHPFKVLSTRKQNIITSTIEFSESGVGQKEAVTGSAWWAYNAVTGYLSHKDRTDEGEGRFNSLLLGGDARINDKALQLAMPDSKLSPVMNLN